MFAAPPDEPIAWKDRRLRGGWLAAAVALVVALAFLPESLTNNDEFYYAGQAYLISHGRLAAQLGDPLLVPQETAAQAFRYPIAWPAVLAVGRLVSFRAMYVVVLLVHLLGGAAVARMLVRRGLRSELAAVYLFHPVLWIYSRTLLSDIPATAALVIAIDAWENRDRKVAGAALGFAGAVRLANVTSLLGFGLSVVREYRRRSRDIAILAFGVVTFFAVQVAVNRILGGYWLVSRYAQQGASMLTAGMVLENVVLYGVGLALLPPFPLLWVLARPRLIDRWAIVAIVVILAHLPISFHNVSPSKLETLVGGQRYVMPAHAVLLVATAGVWGRSRLLRWGWLPVAGGALIAVAACLAMARIENRHRLAARVVASCRPTTLAFTEFANRVAGSVQAQSYRLTWPPYERLASDVLVVAPGMQSNQPGATVSWSSSPPALPGARCQRVGAYAIYDFSGRCPQPAEPCGP